MSYLVLFAYRQYVEIVGAEAGHSIQVQSGSAQNKPGFGHKWLSEGVLLRI